MIENGIGTQHTETFESIKHLDDNGNEYWLARQLCHVLGYSVYRNFLPVIGRAVEACENSGNQSDDHFEEIFNTINIGKGAIRKTLDVKLSRYACYLIVQNGDPSKPIIANGQTYFAIQTRRQELNDNSVQFIEDEQRLALRSEVTVHNKLLSVAAKNAGVETHLDYAIFQDHGYKGLYGGRSSKEIHRHKGLKENQKILDYMSSTELAANLFRTTQAEDKLRRDNIRGKERANQTHFEVGVKVRQTIKELGGTMPENLPKPDKSIQQIKRKRKRLDDTKTSKINSLDSKDQIKILNDEDES